MHKTAIPSTSEYSQDERALLLRWARDAIGSWFERKELDLTPPSQHLGEKRGAFTTLHADGRLRGCIGFVEPIYPLYRTIYETARAAAFGDPRFMPVTEPELSTLTVEISVMSLLFDIRPEDIQVGVHGLVISKGGRRGLLLPQVATEHGWDAQEFLRETCYKAGLPEDAWQKGATIEAFTAEVFGEGEGQ